MSRGQQRRARARNSQQRVTRKARRRRIRKAGSGSVAAVTAIAFGLAGAPAVAMPTEDTAELVADLDPGAEAGEPDELTPFAGAVYFNAGDGVHGIELWRTDGTAAGTVMVKDIAPGAGSGYPTLLTVAGSTLFFSADDGAGPALWKSDGTSGGTVKLAAVDAQQTGIGKLTPAGNSVFFPAHNEFGLELWTSDGTVAGTVMVKDINPGTYDYYGDTYPLDSAPYDFETIGNTVFFRADDGTHGAELWRSDGTEAGTVLVKDIASDDYYYGPRYITNVGGTLFFGADDGVHGRELWKSDGTEAGTVLVKDIANGYPNDSLPRQLANVNGTLYFSARDVHGFEVWKSDGTAAGTVLVRDVQPGAASSNAGDFTVAGGTVFFSADDGTHGRELWRTDGSTAGTVLVEDLDPSAYQYYGYTYPSDSYPSGLTAVGGKVFFSATNDSGRELWRSDGTAAGTGIVKDIRPGAPSSEPEDFTVTPGGVLVFSAEDGIHGNELWRFTTGVAPSNLFTLPRRGRADTKKGTLTLRVSVPGAGTLMVGPSGKRLVKVVTTSVTQGSTSITIKPTKAGMKKLKKELQEAIDDGRKVGKLKVRTAVTFTPTGGTARTIIKQYTLKLK